MDVLNLTKTIEVALLDFAADLVMPAGRMVLSALAGAAELEGGLTSERTRAAVVKGKRQRVYFGRARVMPDEFRSRIFDAHASGQCLNAIARILNAEAVPTSHRGAKWHAGPVRIVVIAEWHDGITA